MARAIIPSIVALATAGMGGVVMLRSLGVFGPVPTDGGAPAWLGVVAGMIFVAGAFCVLVKTSYGVADSQATFRRKCRWPSALSTTVSQLAS